MKLIGRLLYTSNCTRPDIDASVNYLSRLMSHPNVEHQHQAKRFIQGIMDKRLMFNRGVAYIPEAWQDSSFADGLDVKSRTGFVVLTRRAPIAWDFKLQPIVPLSTMEAEYMALCDTTQEVMLLIRLLNEIFLVLEQPT